MTRGKRKKEKPDPRFEHKLKAIVPRFEALGWDLGALKDGGGQRGEGAGAGGEG